MADPKKYRLSDELDAFVREVSASSGGVLKEVDVIRLALNGLRDYWERHGKRALLPLRFDETFVVHQINLPAASPHNVTLTETTPPNLESGSRRLSSRPRRVQTAK